MYSALIAGVRTSIAVAGGAIITAIAYMTLALSAAMVTTDMD